MTDRVFVDTNVLLYWVDESDPDRQRRAASWIDALWRSRRGRTGFQVLQEFFYQATRKQPDLRERFRNEVRNLFAWRPVSIEPELLERAWKLQDRYRLSFWDALIVAAAKSSSCRWLLTEDLQPDQSLDGVTVINPFLRTPEDLPGPV